MNIIPQNNNNQVVEILIECFINNQMNGAISERDNELQYANANSIHDEKSFETRPETIHKLIISSIARK